MTDWDDRLASARADFLDALEVRRFDPSKSNPRWLIGTVVTKSGPRRILVEVGDAFPYRPPRAFPGADPDELDITWHTSPDGWMCLYTDNDENSTPWTDIDSFLARVAEWFDQTEAGWPDDAPVMDADRYIRSEPTGAMLLYGDVDPLVGHYVRLLPDNNMIVIKGIEKPPARRKGGNRSRYAAVRDVGELLRPVRTWDDVRALVPDVDQLEDDIRNRRINVVILRYTRAGRVAALPLRVAEVDDRIGIWVYGSASDADDVRRYRSGPARSHLANKCVLVIGAGAVGSFTSDLLARDGVGHLTVTDWQLLTPGNVVRHLCGRSDIGRPKAQAVAAHIRQAYGTDSQSTVDAVTLPAQALAAVAEHDLVVDATGSGSVTAMLHEAARIVGKTVLTVCVQNDGDVVRVDLLPPVHGDPLPRTSPARGRQPAFYEAGCGDPVSPTPPHAVVHAAALAARHAVGLLTGQPLHPAGEIVTTTTQTTS
jgi:hypothetical protein